MDTAVCVVDEMSLSKETVLTSVLPIQVGVIRRDKCWGQLAAVDMT